MKRLLRVTAVLIATLDFTVTFAQRIITGTITDDKSAPFSSATVAVKSIRVITVTDAAGKYSISVPPDAKTFPVSYVGMEAQELTIGTGNAVSASLASSSSSLTDVVVGYGRAGWINLTTAQTSVGAKEIERTANTPVAQAIQGRAVGVYITQNSGQPGGGISVAIRGISTISGNTEPLFVIDGVQLQGSGTTNSSNPLSSLNPSDIEDVQVLQGPSLTGIYGSRGTTGVFLISQ